MLSGRHSTTSAVPPALFSSSSFGREVNQLGFCQSVFFVPSSSQDNHTGLCKQTSGIMDRAWWMSGNVSEK
jgi:hypothetical protein